MPSASNAVVAPDADALRGEAQTWVERWKALIIRNVEDFHRAASMLTSIAAFKKAVADKFAPSKKAAHEAHAAICRLENEVLAAAAPAERHLRSQVSTWTTEQERARRELQSRLEREERERRETEALDVAADLEAAGDRETAAVVIEEAIAAPPVVFEIPQEKAAGVSTRRAWKYRITNPAEHKRSYLVLDEKKVGALVRCHGPEAAALVGGIEVFEEAIVAVRAAS